MDARRNQVYTGIYSFVPKKESEDSEHGQMKYAFQVIRVQMAVSVEDLIRRLNIYGRRVVFLGDGVPVYRKMLEKGLKVPYFFAPSYLNRQRAAVVGALGIRYFKMGRYETAAEHKPDYLRVSQAERERAAKEKNAAPEIRRMVMEDGAAIAELEYSLFRDAWSEKSILETLKQPNAICLIAEKADRTAGYLLAYTAAEEMEIARIGVVKEMRRQGVARELLGALEKIGKQSGIEKILLDVRSGNEAAHKLYTSEGFTEDGIRKHFYSDPDEDAVLMSKTVK
jgi:tRNA threonylcarbamoyladenosine biosynthesis protein TsaB